MSYAEVEMLLQVDALLSALGPLGSVVDRVERGYFITLAPDENGVPVIAGVKPARNYSPELERFSFGLDLDEVGVSIGGIIHTHTVYGDDWPSPQDLEALPYFEQLPFFVGVVYNVVSGNYYVYYRTSRDAPVAVHGMLGRNHGRTKPRRG